MLSQIVIEVEAHGNPQTMLHLSIDKHLTAENLTAPQAQLLVGEILDCIPVAEAGEPRETIERELRLTRPHRGGDTAGGAWPSPRHSHAARTKSISVLSARPRVSEASEVQRLRCERAPVSAVIGDATSACVPRRCACFLKSATLSL